MIAGALRSTKRDREDSTMWNTLDARRGRSRARSEKEAGDGQQHVERVKNAR